MATPYRIRLQPDPERTLQDPGTIEFMINLTFEQSRGIDYMVYALFTSWRDRDEPVYEAGSHLQYFQSRENRWVNPHIIPTRIISVIPDAYISNFRQALNRGEPWTTIINNPNFVEDRSYPNETIGSTYTAIFLNYFNTTFGVIVGFRDLEFLQGAITLCQWLGLDWREWIIDIHQGDRLMQVMNV